ncbi:uncharacterized protein LOC126784449 [Argentina anserina]|uniref:uncharacterized protein LOC126784449 n=1 Tax=Argentina anserina TaxID=57926 RepID=UPI00217679E7|nr:uncharacterized protein LOC126784449 [Potentilla anserina]XP_050365870.1 uncharacterized protein LOC126784449 [Potentilla anserina]
MRFVESFVYEISNFRCIENQRKSVVVPHQVQLLFSDNTQFRLIPEYAHPIPYYWFQFIELDNLQSRVDDDTFLTDVIGVVAHVPPAEYLEIRGKQTTKQCIVIHDSRGNNVRVTLWDSVAYEFDIGVVAMLPPPVIAAFSSTRVRRLCGHTEVYSTSDTAVFLNPGITVAYDLRARILSPVNVAQTDTNSVDNAVIEVDNMHGYTAQDVFVIGAMITEIQFGSGWYYISCAKCSRKLKFSESYLMCCPRHGSPRIGIPMYKMKISLEDSTGTIDVGFSGKPAEDFFGVTARELVDEQGYNDASVLPDTITDKMFQRYVWRIGRRGSEMSVLSVSVLCDQKNNSGCFIEPDVTSIEKAMNSAGGAGNSANI